MNTGKLGENIACRFLVQKGFHMKQKNYRQIFGELDIIAERKNNIHFIEVKTTSVSDETKNNLLYKPEDAVHFRKRQRLRRIIQGYLKEKRIPEETRWQFDIVTVVLNQKTKQAKVKILENLML